MRHARSLLSLLVLAALGGPARAADQLVAFDETYQQLLNGNVPGETFHHGIRPAPTEPASWVSPVNYARGTAYLHMEVLEKPSKRNTLLTVCFDGPKEGYGCFDSNPYTDVGVHETKVAMGGPDWFQYNKVAWNQRRDDYHLVIKDPALGGTQGGRPPSDYVPTTLRVVLTIVPPGGTYTPPPPRAASDGGAAPAAPDAGVPPDAAPGRDLGAPPPAPDAAPAFTDAATATPTAPADAAPGGGPSPPPPARASATTAGCALARAPAPGGMALLLPLVLPLVLAAAVLLRRRGRKDRLP